MLFLQDLKQSANNRPECPTDLCTLHNGLYYGWYFSISAFWMVTGVAGLLFSP